MPLDHYVTLGRSGLRVSPLCLGTMTFGDDWGWGADVDSCRAMLDHYVGRGGNFIDTANNYTEGHAEAIIGEWLADSGIRRDGLVLATKFASNLYRADPNGGGASRKAIVQQCEQSLRRLRTDYIDLYWMHYWDSFTPIEETMRALDDLVTSGKVRYAGLSDTPAWKVAQAHTTGLLRGWSPLVAIQVEYSLLQRTVEGELLPMARELALGVTPWAPLAGGALSGKYDRDHPLSQSDRGGSGRRWGEAEWALIEALRRVAGRRDASVAAVALAWVCAQPGISSPIVGARSVAQLDANLAALDVALSPEDHQELGALTEPALPFPVGFLNRAAANLIHAGATVNGVASVTPSFVPADGKPRW